MNYKFVKLAVVCVFLLMSFLAGRWVESLYSRYHFEIRGSREHPFALGPVKWSYVTETVGLPLLDPGTTMLEFQNRVLYKAKRGLQEGAPYARDLKTAGNQIDWRDGDYHYILKVEADTEAKPKPTSASQADQTPIREEAPAIRQ